MIQFATICCVIQHTDHNSNNIVCNNSPTLATNINCKYMYFTVSQCRNTVDSLLTDTPVKRTLRVGPCLCLFPLFDSL